MCGNSNFGWLKRDTPCKKNESPKPCECHKKESIALAACTEEVYEIDFCGESHEISLDIDRETEVKIHKYTNGIKKAYYKAGILYFTTNRREFEEVRGERVTLKLTRGRKTAYKKVNINRTIAEIGCDLREVYNYCTRECGNTSISKQFTANGVIPLGGKISFIGGCSSPEINFTTTYYYSTLNMQIGNIDETQLISISGDTYNKEPGTYYAYMKCVDELGTEYWLKDSFKVYSTQLQVSIPEVECIKNPINSVVLNAIASNTDGSAINYLWEKVSGNSATIVSPNSATTEVTGLDYAGYVFKVTVTNEWGVKSSATVNVCGAEVPTPTVQCTNVVYDYFQALDGITLQPTYENALTYFWSQVSGDTVDLGDNTTPTLTLKDLNPGTYEFKIKIIGESNKSAECVAKVTITREAAEIVTATLQETCCSKN